MSLKTWGNMSFFVQILLVLPGAVSRAQSEKETLKRDQNRKPAAQKIHFSLFANPSALKKINGFSFCHLSILCLFLLFFSIVSFFIWTVLKFRMKSFYVPFIMVWIFLVFQVLVTTTVMTTTMMIMTMMMVLMMPRGEGGSGPTCVGERWMRLARCSRSGAERYFCCLKRRSSSYTYHVVIRRGCYHSVLGNLL